MEQSNDQQLTVSDLSAIRNLIDIACTRGAFRANEMKTVGTIYDKLSGFLDSLVSQAESEMMAQEGSTQQGDSND